MKTDDFTAIEDYAEQFLDAAPEDTESTAEYDWELRTLTRQEMIETGLMVNFGGHAQLIGLDPSKSDFARPVVVSFGDSHERYPFAVWDGVHRVMSALALNIQEIPAVVGVRKDVFKQMDRQTGS